VDDAVHTFKWLTEDRGYKPQNVTLAGDSAGGAVCLLLMLKLKKLNLPMPGGAFLMSPWTDMSVSQPSFASNAKTDVLLGNEPNILLWALGKSCLSELTMERLKSPDISPLYAEDLSGTSCMPIEDSLRCKPFSDNIMHGELGFPPLLIHAGSYERLVDDSIQFAEKAKAHGVPVTLKVWQCQQHVFQCFFNFIPEASEALDEAAAWIANKSSRVTNQPTNNLVS
jgi:acetyl esterase/lipase